MRDYTPGDLAFPHSPSSLLSIFPKTPTKSLMSFLVSAPRSWLWVPHCPRPLLLFSSPLDRKQGWVGPAHRLRLAHCWGCGTGWVKACVGPQSPLPQFTFPGPGGSSPLALPFSWAADLIAHPRGFESQLESETSLSSCRLRLSVPSCHLSFPVPPTPPSHSFPGKRLLFIPCPGRPAARIAAE